MSMFVKTLNLGGAGPAVAIKDSIDVAGVPTQAGCQALADVQCAAVALGADAVLPAAAFAWLLVFAALLLLAFIATPPRLAGETPLFWIGQARPLPLPPTPPHAPGRGPAAPPPARESHL